jgi:hypothetical protein
MVRLKNVLSAASNEEVSKKIQRTWEQMRQISTVLEKENGNEAETLQVHVV